LCHFAGGSRDENFQRIPGSPVAAVTLRTSHDGALGRN
jgi:hypothetical protein